ncbi:MAG TPA: DivIVA domain-containing protein [Actinomycetota bacterium]|nr:DivIVA domain-containing protein [Actinomycetota bacterium]
MRKKKQDTQEAGFTTPPTRPRLTPIDVQQKEFRLAFRGYNERDVDEFLDLVTEELAAFIEENRRLQDHGDSNVASLGGADVTWASREAEGILERARADAASTVAEAEARAAAILAAAGEGRADPRGVIAPYLNREREFLQSLGQLVQQHADSMRRMVRSAKEQAGASSSAAPSPAGGDVNDVPRVRIEPAQGRPGSAPVQPRAEDFRAEPAPGRHRSVRELFWGED